MDPTHAAVLDEKRVDLIQSELDLAFAFLQVADTTGIREVSEALHPEGR
jgi:hypothetical protein